MPASLFHESLSSRVSRLASRIVQNGVVALSTEARPAPISVWPAKISEKGTTLLRIARMKKLEAMGSTSQKGRPARGEIDVQRGGGDGDTEKHQREGMDFGHRDAREEERPAPDGAEQQ